MNDQLDAGNYDLDLKFFDSDDGLRRSGYFSRPETLGRIAKWIKSPSVSFHPSLAILSISKLPVPTSFLEQPHMKDELNRLIDRLLEPGQCSSDEFISGLKALHALSEATFRKNRSVINKRMEERIMRGAFASANEIFDLLRLPEQERVKLVSDCAINSISMQTSVNFWSIVRQLNFPTEHLPSLLTAAVKYLFAFDDPFEKFSVFINEGDKFGFEEYIEPGQLLKQAALHRVQTATANPFQEGGADAVVKNLIQTVVDVKTFDQCEPNVLVEIQREAALALAQRLFSVGKPVYVSDILARIPDLPSDQIRARAVLGVQSALRRPGDGETAVEISRDALAHMVTECEARVLEIKQWIEKHGLEPIRWDEVKIETEQASKRLLQAFQPLTFKLLALNLGLPSKERERIVSSIRPQIVKSVLRFQIYNQSADKIAERILDTIKLFKLSWNEFAYEDIPLLEYLDGRWPELAEKRASDPWNDAFSALEKLQARSKNEAYDPWKLELAPLAERCVREGVIDRDSAADGRLLVEYVRTFGMLDLPAVSRLYFQLKKKPFGALSSEDRELLVETVGKKAERLTSEQLINELRLLRRGIMEDILADRVPRKIERALGTELFDALCGKSSFVGVGTVRELAYDWRDYAMKASLEADWLAWRGDTAKAVELYESTRIADGYEEATLRVPKRVREEDALRNAQEETYVGNDEGLARWLARQGNAVSRSQLVLSSGFREEGFPELASAIVHQMTVKEGNDWEKPDDDEMVAFMEKLAAMEPSESGDDHLLAVSMAHMKYMGRRWFETLKSSAFATPESVRSLAEFVRQYLTEHYLNPGQDPKHTQHAAFSDSLRGALARTWGVEGGAAGHPAVRVADALDRARRETERTSRDLVEIALVPVHGMGRVSAGQIGDACYSAQAKRLANGEVPRIKAALYVTGRGRPGAERLAGSALFVETRRADTGGRVIAIRANNPRQNLVMRVDAKALLRQTVEETIATAMRRKIKHVAVVLGGAPKACSNREEIADASEELYGGRECVALVEEDETKFNDYDIWNPDGETPTAIVWTNDDPEAT